MKDRVEFLIAILFDNTAREDERDDAAMDLGQFDDNLALAALLKIAKKENENQFILNSCGESIARIWVRRNQFDVMDYKQLNLFAQSEVYAYIRENKPEWLEKII